MDSKNVIISEIIDNIENYLEPNRFTLILFSTAQSTPASLIFNP